MSSFKIGERVRTQFAFSHGYREGVVKEVNLGNGLTHRVEMPNGTQRWYKESELTPYEESGVVQPGLSDCVGGGAQMVPPTFDAYKAEGITGEGPPLPYPYVLVSVIRGDGGSSVLEGYLVSEADVRLLQQVQAGEYVPRLTAKDITDQW